MQTIELTAEYRSRTIAAIAETQRNIDREMRYSPEFRKNDQIEWCKNHIANLRAALESGKIEVGK